MRLIKLTMVETEGFNDCVIRPYEANFKERTIDSVLDATEDGTRITPLKLANVTRDFIGLATDDKIFSRIDNGWDERRIMFAAVVEVGSGTIHRTYEYIVGYTDKSDYGIRMGKVKFDPNMRLYFNSVTRIHMTESSVGRGKGWQPKIQAHDQILNRNSITGEGRNRRQDIKPALLRPTDLFRRQDVESTFGSYLSKNSNGRVNNLTGGFSERLVASSRVNNAPTAYLERSLGAYIKAGSNPSAAYIDDMTQDQIVSDAVELLDENLLETDPYLARLKQDTNILRSGYITFGELMDMNPEFDEDRNLPFSRIEDLRKDSSYVSGLDGVNWSSDEPEAIAAAIIAQSLPAIMINAMYSMVRNLVLNTRARFGEPKVLAGKTFPFVEGMDVRSSLDYFEMTVEHVLLQDVSKGGMFEIDAMINANIDDKIEIFISIDGGEEAHFVFPTFADSLLAPVMAADMDAVDQLSGSIIQLANGVNTGRANRAPSHVDTPTIRLSTSGVRDDDDRRDTDRDRGPKKRDW